MLTEFQREAPAREIMAALEEDGGVIVHDFLEPTQVDELERDFKPHLDAVDWGHSDGGDSETFFGRQTKRLHGLLARSPRFGDFVTQPLLMAMCEHFLKPRCRDFRLSTGELMALGKGQEPQMFHRDADSWMYFPEPRPEILVSVNAALTDFTEENGATRVVPGSHLWPRDRKPAEEEVVSAVMPRRSALLYSGNVLHGGGANRTDEIRIGLYAGFLLSWLRPIENHLVTNGIETLKTAAPRVQRLLDYS
ncbi:MAG: phytanoyl-CoA dioxygenase family protein, partial [Proteobacteria bacterium]|nr:phytanoyl-CoA dioxygenase family protein [Pseudomonadota bacterium]